MVHCRATARFGAEGLRTVPRLKVEVARLQLPMLIVHGQADRLCLPGGSQYLFAAIASRDKELKLYPGAFHKLHNDLDSDQVLADVTDWLEQHLE